MAHVEEQMFETIYDSPVIEKGEYGIFYVKPAFHREYNFRREGMSGWMKEMLEETHENLGWIDAEDHTKIFHKMQGFNWSPNGEARNIIESKGLHHTSMSVGDVIVHLESSSMWMIAPIEFRELT